MNNSMNCHAVLPLLDDHVDGVLDPLRDRAVRFHLAECNGCRERATALSELIGAAARLSDSIEPDRDLWDDIAPRLSAPKHRRPTWHLASIAASVLVLLLGGAYYLLRGDTTAPADPVPVSPATSLPAAHRPSTVALEQAERAFGEARQALLLALDQKRESLSPDTLSAVDTNLDIIESAIGEIRDALAKDPANHELSRMLVAYHHRELELLQRVTRHASRL